LVFYSFAIKDKEISMVSRRKKSIEFNKLKTKWIHGVKSKIHSSKRDIRCKWYIKYVHTIDDEKPLENQDLSDDNCYKIFDEFINT
jgi:hypothetical protein